MGSNSHGPGGVEGENNLPELHMIFSSSERRLVAIRVAQSPDLPCQMRDRDTSSKLHER